MERLPSCPPPAEPTSLSEKTIGGKSPDLPIRRHIKVRRPLLAALFTFLSLGLSGTALGLYLGAVGARTTLAGLTLSNEPIAGVFERDLPGHIQRVAARVLSRPVRLLIGRERVEARLSDLGMIADEAATSEALLSKGHSGNPLLDLGTRWRSRRHGLDVPLQVWLNSARALEFLGEIKDRVDRSAQNARLDLERHTIAEERDGHLLRVYDSLVRLEYAARALSHGAEIEEIELSVAVVPPRVRREHLREIDVSTVLASWETRYSSAPIDTDRTYNLKVGADKLNGYILRPGEIFSFNQAVGNRTEKEGYRVAPVIQAGELIDGLAGGMCQIASTLHAAAFFAGLEILRATPHSRPSAYIPMGLDSTVVWPQVDLKLKNPYDFPLVLHYTVNQGSVKVEILGKRRPYKVAFEREILSESGFATQVRGDHTMPYGQRIIEQEGYPGYRIKRRRYIFTGKWQLDRRNENRPAPEGLIGKREWEIFYPSTTQIVRVGTGPATLAKKEPPPSHRIPPVPRGDKPFLYIVR